MACGELQFGKLLGKTTAQEMKKRRATIELPETYQLEEVTYTLKEDEEVEGTIYRISLNQL